MKTISPNLEGIEEINIAQEQDEYFEVRAGATYDINTGSPCVILRWRLTPEERQKLLDGEDLWSCHLTFGMDFQPLMMSFGKPDWLPPLAV